MIGRLRGRLVLEETVYARALKRPAQGRVPGRVSRDDRSRGIVGYGVRRRGEPRLVERELPEEVQAPRADVADFEHEVPGKLVLRVGVVLVDVRRADVAVEDRARKGH